MAGTGDAVTHLELQSLLLLGVLNLRGLRSADGGDVTAAGGFLVCRSDLFFSGMIS